MLRKLVLAAAWAALMANPLSGASAQGLPPDDGGFEIETEETVEEKGFLENLSQYVGATFGNNSGTSNAVDRTISAVAINLEMPEIFGLKSAVNFDLGAYENTYKLELSGNGRQTVETCQSVAPTPSIGMENDPALTQAELDELDRFYQNDCWSVYDREAGAYRQPELERVVDDSFAELTEAYIQWEPTSFATVRAGRQPIVLGQFEVFSPLMFTSPMKARGTKTKTTKADLSYAQDGLQLSLFPLSQLELSFTAIPKMRLDPVNEERFEQFAALKSDFTNFMPGESGVQTLQDIGDNDMSVARVIYYGDRLTFGITAMTGAETNEDPIRDARLVAVGCEEYFLPDTPPIGSDCFGRLDNGQPDLPYDPANNYVTYALDDDKGLRYAETEVLALEAKLNLTPKLSFIYEVTIVEGEKELGILPSGGREGFRPVIPRFVDGDPADPNFDPNANDIELLPIFAELITDNDRKPYINVETTMHSGGLIYQGERLLINAQLAQRVQKGASAKEEELRKKLDWDSYQGDDTEENGSGVSDIIPIVNAVLLLGGEKQGFVGAGFGTFGQNFGFGLSGGWRFFERLEIGAFGGMALDVTGADEIEAEGYDTPQDEGYISFGVNYLF